MIRSARSSDVDQLVELENYCFESDRLSRRSFKYFLSKARAVILVDEEECVVTGYVLLLFHRGTSLSRLYSIAVLPRYRKSGIARQLINAAEAAAMEYGCITLRLEVRVDNAPSIALFKSLGYCQFGRYLKYYEDAADALRLEKRLSSTPPNNLSHVPYYQQTLEFTCGPASLMMAMSALNKRVVLDRSLELQLWREATTIFMTSGHGGSGPYGLAIAAYRRGFDVEVYVAKGKPLFIDSVRSEEKKEVIRLVEEDFLKEINNCSINLAFGRVGAEDIIKALDNGAIPIILISSWRIYKEKFPHWVVVTGYDKHFIYVHDSYIDVKKGKTVSDCLNMPITLEEFSRMTTYGKSGQWAALILRGK